MALLLEIGRVDWRSVVRLLDGAEISRLLLGVTTWTRTSVFLNRAMPRVGFLPFFLAHLANTAFRARIHQSSRAAPAKNF